MHEISDQFKAGPNALFTLELPAHDCYKKDHVCHSGHAGYQLGPNIYWTSNYGTGIVFIGNMLSWLSFHNFV